MGANEDLLIQYCQDSSLNEIINLIETEGDNLDINTNRAEPLRISVSKLDYDITLVLLQNGANPNVASADDKHDSAFDLADNLNDPAMSNLIGPF
jgi:hypothetical protein